MSKDANRRPASSRLHPWIYAAIFGLALFYILSAWFGFAGSGYTDYLLMIASFFVLGALALPFIAWRAWRHSRGLRAEREGRETFRQWARGEFDIGQGHVSGATAAVEILLPIAAVAFGMMAFAIVARLVG
jgi:hypothetical protein